MNSNSQSENPSNKEYNINNNKENSDISSNYKKRTLRDSELDHEELSGLLGGSVLDGHYHLTYEEWEAIRRILDNPEYDGGFASTTEEEYEANIEHWFDGGYSPPEQIGEVDGGRATI